MQSENSRLRANVDEIKQRLKCDLQEVAGKLTGTPITLLSGLFLDGSQQGIRDAFARLLAIGQRFPTAIELHPTKWAQVTADGLIAEFFRGTYYEIALPPIQALLSRLAIQASDSMQPSIPLEFRRIQLDEQLFVLKLSAISRRMHEASLAAQRLPGPFTNHVDAQIDVVRKYADEVDRICREVWLAQGNSVTPEFVRKIVLQKIILIIQTRMGSIKHIIEKTNRGQRSTNQTSLLRRLAMTVIQLKSEMTARYEVEARELEYKRGIGTVALRNEQAAGAFLEDGQGSGLRSRAVEATKKLSVGLTHSVDYRSVTLRGQTHSLTSRQAQVVELLHKAFNDGNPELGKDFILEQLGTANSRFRDTFKTNQPAWKALIKHGKRKGLFRLNT